MLSIAALAAGVACLAVSAVLFVRARAWRPTHPFTIAVAVESLGAVTAGLRGLPRETFGGVENADLVDGVLVGAEAVVGQVRHNVLTTGTGHGVDFDWTAPVEVPGEGS